MPDIEKVIKKAERIMCSTVDRNMIDSFCEDVIALLKLKQLDIEALKNAIQGMVEGQCIIAGDKLVDIVRCKDCKFQVDRGRRYPECDKHFLRAEDNWFCADGERQEGQ